MTKLLTDESERADREHLYAFPDKESIRAVRSVIDPETPTEKGLVNARSARARLEQAKEAM